MQTTNEARISRRLRPRSHRFGTTTPLLVAVALFSVVATLAPTATAGTNQIDIPVIAGDGSGRRLSPGRPCADGGDGAYWHYDYSTALAPGAFSKIAGEALVHLDLHSDLQRYQNASGVYPPGTDPTAFLLGEESHASLLNDRGSVKLRLRSGSCEQPTLAFDGSVARHPVGATGTWAVDSGTGAYRDVTGTGTFRLGDAAGTTGAEVNPGADNALDLRLTGSLQQPEPSLNVEVVSTYWGGLGTDYVSRRVTVVYKVTNAGPGDSFGANVLSITSPTRGVTPIGSGARVLGNLPAGQSRIVSIRFQFGLVGPCALVILGCKFDSTVTADLPDALDNSHVLSQTVRARAPLLPPPV